MDPNVEYKGSTPKQILKFEKVQVKFEGNSKIVNGYKTNSIQIDGDIFLNELL